MTNNLKETSWRPDYYYFIPSFRRHRFLARTTESIAALAAKYQVSIESVVVDGTEEACSQETLANSSTYYQCRYIHRPGAPFYQAPSETIGQLDPSIPVFFGTDDELGMITKASVIEFSNSLKKVGVPQYLMIKREQEEFVQLYRGWTQTRDLCLVDGPLTRLRLFADQGVILFYALYDGRYFAQLADFVNSIRLFLENIETGIERFIEPLYSLTTLISPILYLSDSSYLRRVDRRKHAVEKHTARFSATPVYPWILIPRLKKTYPTEFNELLRKIAKFWSLATEKSIPPELVESSLTAFAYGYKTVASRRWREGYEFVYFNPTLIEDTKNYIQPLPRNGDSDAFLYVVNPKLEMSDIQRIQFRREWICNPLQRDLFTQLAPALFEDEDEFLNTSIPKSK